MTVAIVMRMTTIHTIRVKWCHCRQQLRIILTSTYTKSSLSCLLWFLH